MNEEELSMLESKQNYLRSEVIDRGYNAEEFVAFFQERFGDSFEHVLFSVSIEKLKEVS